MIPNKLAKPMTLLLGPLQNEESLKRIQQLDKSDFDKVVMVDGAANFFRAPWPSNWQLIGDADSCSEELKKHFDVLLPTHKDQSDLSYVLEHAISNDHQLIHAEGFNGGSLDHELINLGELSLFLERRPSTQINWGPQLKVFPAGTHIIKHFGSFSLFGLKDQTLGLSGSVKWPLKEKKIRACSSLTLRNKAFGELQMQCSAPTFMYIQQDPL
jgi:thiamine pyrophosphokinase